MISAAQSTLIDVSRDLIASSGSTLSRVWLAESADDVLADSFNDFLFELSLPYETWEHTNNVRFLES